MPSLDHVVMPRGIVDLARDTPPRNVSLIAPTSTLVAREGTHSALLNLLVQAAAEIHGAPDWFARSREFPSSRSVDFPLAEEARRFYQSGPPFLQRYLPFWLAKLCIHPKQVTAVHRALTPTPANVEWARRVLAAAASSQGAVQLDGKMIDRPVILKAQGIVARADAAG